MDKQQLKIILCEPRGFCAGVERAIEIVERALIKYGSPIYVRHEIVHNKWVVDDLKSRGVIFVDNIEEVPDDAVTIFSAHGVSEAVENSAVSRSLPVIDATCPLVTKVHKEAQKYEEDRKIILIGHKGHPEVEGTSGRVKADVTIISSANDVDNLPFKENENLAYVTQTTLSVDDTREVIDALKYRYPQIEGPSLKDICYATQNRQNAVRELKDKADLLLVVGAKNSSNSNRLRDLGNEIGIESYLVDDAAAFNPEWLEGKESVGITAGASAPEHLVEGVIEAIKTQANYEVSTLITIKENIHFKLPKEVREV